MEYSQRWLVRTRAGNEFTIHTLPGVGPMQALDNAGFMARDIDWIREAA